MAHPALSREEVVDRLMNVIRQHGYDGASLSAFSDATGLRKSSLYHYFPGGKVEMSRAVLDRSYEWIRRTTEEAVNGRGTPEQRLQSMLREIARLYEGGTKSCVLGSIALSGGRAVLQQELQKTLRLWIDGLAHLIREAGVPAAEARLRAEDAIAGIQGSLVVSAGLNETRPFQRLLRRLQRELLAG